MRLNAPKKSTWWVAVVLGVLGLIGYYLPFPYIATISFWLVAFGWIILALGTYLKGF